jgi:hypothetical protein
LLGIFFSALEVVSPILAGRRLYKNLTEWWKEHFKLE